MRNLKTLFFLWCCIIVAIFIFRKEIGNFVARPIFEVFNPSLNIVKINTIPEQSEIDAIIKNIEDERPDCDPDLTKDCDIGKYLTNIVALAIYVTFQEGIDHSGVEIAYFETEAGYQDYIGANDEKELNGFYQLGIIGINHYGLNSLSRLFRTLFHELGHRTVGIDGISNEIVPHLFAQYFAMLGHAVFYYEGYNVPESYFAEHDDFFLHRLGGHSDCIPQPPSYECVEEWTMLGINEFADCDEKRFYPCQLVAVDYLYFKFFGLYAGDFEKLIKRLCAVEDDAAVRELKDDIKAGTACKYLSEGRWAFVDMLFARTDGGYIVDGRNITLDYVGDFLKDSDSFFCR